MHEMRRHHENDSRRLLNRYLFPGKTYNHGNREIIEKEKTLSKLDFYVKKFTNRTKPENPRRILLIPCFGEFGCETVGALYLIPRLIQKYPGCYVIAMGWSGRDYLYKHLVDEFWELKEEYQWLREHCLAFHHNSKNLKRFEKTMRGKTGIFVAPEYMARQIMLSECRDCNSSWKEDDRQQKCRACGSDNIRKALFYDMPNCWQDVVVPPSPSKENRLWAKKQLPSNAVGVFARSRKCYGRNLPKDFYENLVIKLRSMGYEPVWLGEPSTTAPAPFDDVLDFSRRTEQRDMEKTVAMIGEMKFTVQFWTASTRLAAIAGTPYLLFESPDQIWGQGQEGFRLELITRGGPRKLVANDYVLVAENQNLGLEIFERSVREIENGNFDDSIGLVSDVEEVERMMNQFRQKVGV